MERGGKKWTVGKYAKDINEWQTPVKDQPMASAKIVTRQAGKKIVINRKRGKMLNSEKRVREENLLVVSTLKILTNRKPRERIYQR